MVKTYKGSSEENRPKLNISWKSPELFCHEAFSGSSHDEGEESGALGKSLLYSSFLTVPRRPLGIQIFLQEVAPGASLEQRNCVGGSRRVASH